MPEYPFAEVIEDAESMRQIMGTPSELVIRKQLDHVDTHARRALLERMSAQGKQPLLAIGVQVRECF